MAEQSRYEKYKPWYEEYSQTHKPEAALRSRQFLENHPGYQKGKYQKHRETTAKSYRSWRENYPEHNHIHQLISHHPERYPVGSECEFCGAIGKLERGHLDYENNGFNYLTVCHACNHWMDIPLDQIVLTKESKPT